MGEEQRKRRKRARGAGEGTIFKRTLPGGRVVWVGQVSSGFAETDGRRKRHTVYGATQAEAREKLSGLQEKVERGVDVEAGRQKLHAFLTQWLDEVKAPGLRATTVQNYRDLIELHIAHNPPPKGVARKKAPKIVSVLGNRRLDKITPAHLIAWQNQLRGRGVGARTRQAAYTLLRNALADAVRWNLLLFNPAERMEKPKAETKRRTGLDRPQVAALLRAAWGHPYEAFVMLGVLHGLRIGEIAGLRWCDLDLEAGTVRVERSLAELRDGKRVAQAPKTAASRRELPLSGLAREALRRHRARVAAEALRRERPAPSGESLVFTDGQGGALRRSNFHRRVWRPLLEAAGLADRGVRFHDLRHAAASVQLAAGTDLTTVSGFLGHASPAVTMRVYAHALESEKGRTATTIDKLFAPGQKR